MSTSEDKTPQQRLDEDPELLARVTQAASHPEQGVPRPARRDSDEDVIPPELRPGRW